MIIHFAQVALAARVAPKLDESLRFFAQTEVGVGQIPRVPQSPICGGLMLATVRSFFEMKFVGRYSSRGYSYRHEM
jgi:hypothetical protein